MFQNLHILDENYRIDDYFDLDITVDQYESKINDIKSSASIAIVAPFWYGKTTFLNQLKKRLNHNNWRIDFDAWKYPNREDLWEAFVLETVKQINWDKEVKKIEKKIKWTSTTNKYIDIITDIIWIASEKLWGINILDKFADIFQKEPITKVYEFQKILSSIFDKVTEENIYIVIEDIDRSGDAGIFFLETISYFFKNQYNWKRVILLIPIWSNKRTDNIESYLKSIDYNWNLSFTHLKCWKLIDRIFEERYFNNKTYETWQIISFLEWFFKEFSHTTIRLLKKWLRQSVLSYNFLTNKYWESIDFRLCLLIEFSKLVKNPDWIIYYEKWIKDKKIWKRDSIFTALIYCLMQENHRIRWRLLDNIYTETYKESIWWMIKELHIIETLDIKMVDYQYSDQKVTDKILYYTDQFDRENTYLGISNLYFT
jgi:hypothetical protein